MAPYLDEEELWKCSKHPSKRRRSGVCPICLRDRLLTLCPNCASVRPCSCYATTSSSSSSPSSSFSRFSFAGDGTGVGTMGPVHNLIESEPAFRRSRSVGVPFQRSRSRFMAGANYKDSDSEAADKDSISSSGLNMSKWTTSFWSLFKLQKTKKARLQGHDPSRDVEAEEGENGSKRAPMMMRSRSMAVPAVACSGFGGRDFRAPAKGKGWYFPSPMKVFRQSKVSKIVHQRSPLYRG